MAGSWHIWVDTGGTFTDCVAVDENGRTRRAKVLSTSRLRSRVKAKLGDTSISLEEGEGWQAIESLDLLVPGRDEPWRVVGISPDRIDVDRPLPPDITAGSVVELASDEEAPVLAARLATGIRGPLEGVAFRLGTTKGTNALLERRFEAPAFFVTAGFKDLMRIGDQRRPDLFALRVVKPDPLHADVVEVAERLDSRGSVVCPLDDDALRDAARELASRGTRNAAVALAHAWTNPDHEQRVCAALREAGFVHVAVSSEVAPTVGLLARARTAIVSAALRPIVGDYLDRVGASIGRGSTLHVMTSAGGLNTVDRFDPTDGLLSGPAGGVMGGAKVAQAAGYDRVISFDMGGTSTDVARVEAHGAELDDRHGVGNSIILAPALAIRTVAAGGGSICTFELDQLRVGPESAGADPGPACYGAGGPLTITDVNLLLGRLDADRFGVPLDTRAAHAALDSMLDHMETRIGRRPARRELLLGLFDLANEHMAGAISLVSAERGYDPADYAIVAFGGAAGQHACGVARRLGVRTVLVPRDASLLSAIGIGASSMTRFAHEVIMRVVEQVDVDAVLSRLAEQATGLLVDDGVDRSRIVISRRQLTLRPSGHDGGVDVDVTQRQPVIDAYREAYARQFGHAAPAGEIEVVSARVMAADSGSGLAVASEPEAHAGEASETTFVFGGAETAAPVVERSALTGPIAGPALIVEAHTTTVVEPGWVARPHESGSLVVEAEAGPKRPVGAEAVAAELVIKRVTDIAARMGETLRRTSVSANVKERLDYSCTVLDDAGRVVASAPHMPVHLGAMGLCVRRVRETIELSAGDVALTNHPAYGGSHLPDLTTITPVDVDGEIVAYVATRAHHAEIGGARPGSMSPSARSLADEGAAIAPIRIVESGVWREQRLREVLTAGHHPSRSPETNIADVRASVAANEQGRAAIESLIREYKTEQVRCAMQSHVERSGRLVREAVARLGDMDARAEQHLDDGTPIKAHVRCRDGGLTIDLRGSGGVHEQPFNAPLAVTRSAVMYVLRLLIDEDVPLNDGLLEPIRIITEPGLLDPPFSTDPTACPAVAAGNVETSQRLVDTLLLAFGVCACSQGTMNNVAFGSPAFGFYETMCGGSGASPGGDGADAVHTHMTNSAITDVEVVELRAPVRIRRFEVRPGSGGQGHHRGGDGVIRDIEFLAPAEVSILSQHRVECPYGVAGGLPGLTGEQVIIHADGTSKPLQGVDEVSAGAGDVLSMRTPGGGGWGPVEA